jgi:hypothetical protein
MGVEEERFHVVPVGIDPAPFDGLLHRSGPRIRIGVMGSVIPSKGIHVLLEAALQLDPVRTEIRIHGEATPWHQDQDYGERLRAQVEPDGPLVRFLGLYPDGGAGDVLAGLDVLVVPSIWPEAFGMTIREAWLADVPVVASRTARPDSCSHPAMRMTWPAACGVLQTMLGFATVWRGRPSRWQRRTRPPMRSSPSTQQRLPPHTDERRLADSQACPRLLGVRSGVR